MPSKGKWKIFLDRQVADPGNCPLHDSFSLAANRPLG
jgi:hypothetical protein